MPTAPDIIREIERLARKRGWSQRELARQLSVNPTLLSHLRSGRRRLTTLTLARICSLFSTEMSVKECMWTYLRYEMHLSPEDAGFLPVPAGAAGALDRPTRTALRRFVRGFPHRLVDGRGLLITGASATLLSAAAAYVADALRSAGVRVVLRLAHEAVRPSEAALIRRARLVVLERVEYAPAAVQDLLAERLDLERPVVVTSVADLTGSLSADLVRVLSGRCTRVALPDAPASDE